MKKMRNFRWMALGIFVVLASVGGFSSGDLDPERKRNVGTMPSAGDEGQGAQLMMTTGSSRAGDTTPKLQGDFSRETRVWIEKTLGKDAEPMLKEIATSGRLYAPAVGMMDSLLNAPDINDPNWKSTKFSDLSRGVHMAQVTLPNGTRVGQAAAYTNRRMLKNDEVIQEQNARQWLHDALYMEGSEGVVINPKTRFMRPEVMQSYTSMNRFGVAEFIGFLEVGDDVGAEPFHKLANAAFEAEKYFQVLYYWGRSYRTPRHNDDWKKASVAKLRSYFALDFPGSRERAKGELEWMEMNHPAPELAAVRVEFGS